MKKFNYLLAAVFIMATGYTVAKNNDKDHDTAFTPAAQFNTSGTMIGHYNQDKNLALIHVKEKNKRKGASGDEFYQFKNIKTYGPSDLPPTSTKDAQRVLIGTYTKVVNGKSETIRLYSMPVDARLNFIPADAFKSTSENMICHYNPTKKTAVIHSQKKQNKKTVRYEFKDVVAAGPNIRIDRTKLTLIGSYGDAKGQTITLYGTQITNKEK